MALPFASPASSTFSSPTANGGSKNVSLGDEPAVPLLPLPLPSSSNTTAASACGDASIVKGGREGGRENLSQDERMKKVNEKKRFSLSLHNFDLYYGAQRALSRRRRARLRPDSHAHE